MTLVRLLLLGVLLASLAGCSVVPTALANAEAGSEKLVTPRHPQCDHGQQLVAYLQTGNNDGLPDLDEQYADEVGALSVAQERAKADDWITNCDARADASEQLAAATAQQEVQEQQDAAQAAQEETEEEAQAAKVRETQNKQLAAECADASGRFDATHQRCYSTVTGNPSGFTNEWCSDGNGNSAYLFPVNGNFVHPNSGRPGCFT
jgi:hypothetical protein